MKILITKKEIKIEEYDPIVKGSIGVKASYEVTDSSEWLDLSLVMVFKNGLDKSVKLPIDSSKSDIEIPQIVVKKAGAFMVGIFGVKDGLRKVSLWSEPLEILDGTDTTSEDAPPPEDLYAELLKTAQNAENIANSVREDADSGKFQGPQGKQGIQGPQGEPGNDYILTSADKQDIAALVINTLPTWQGGSY